MEELTLLVTKGPSKEELADAQKAFLEAAKIGLTGDPGALITKRRPLVAPTSSTATITTRAIRLAVNSCDVIQCTAGTTRHR